MRLYERVRIYGFNSHTWDLFFCFVFDDDNNIDIHGRGSTKMNTTGQERYVEINAVILR